MDAVKKMAIVPTDYIAQLQNTKQAPVDVQLSQLDREMKLILENSSIPADIKVKLYSHTLYQHGEIQDVPKPLEMEIKKVKGEYTAPSVTELMKVVPAAKAEEGKNLADFLQRAATIKWTTNNQLMVDGMPLDGSNVYALFEYATRERHASPPTGWGEFLTQLKDSNVPKIAVGNKYAHPQLGFGRVKRKRAKHAAEPESKKKKKPQIRWSALYK